jgi:hypothetical protein
MVLRGLVRAFVMSEQAEKLEMAGLEMLKRTEDPVQVVILVEPSSVEQD